MTSRTFKPEHIAEYRKRGLISDQEVIFDTTNYNPRKLPYSPFDYISLVSNPSGIGEVHPDDYGKEVAIIGAGVSGLCTAYELMKLGLKPTIYEANGIGGRTMTHRFEGDPKAYAELGAMRIPLQHKTIAWYMDQFGIERLPFPSPLKVPTTVFYNQKRYNVYAGEGMPPEVEEATRYWDQLVNPIVEYIQEAINDLPELSKRWAELMDTYEHKSIYQVLYEANWPKQVLEQFGSVGAGGAPFGPLYHQVSFTEILRIIVLEWWGDVEMVKGGFDQIPTAFWEKEVECAHWGKMSVNKLNGGATMPGIVEISTEDDGTYLIDTEGGKRKYQNVIITCSPRTVEVSINTSRHTFSEQVWNAMRNQYLIPGGRVAIRTKTAFWKDKPELLSTTVTDEMATHMFLFDFEDTESGVICLSYTIGVTAIKFDAFDDMGKVERCFNTIEKIYGKETVDLIKEQMVDGPACFQWEEAPGFNGSFRLPVPGFQIDDTILFSQGKFLSHSDQENGDYNVYQDNGVYLSGDCVSWSSGWIESAVGEGINSALSVINRLKRLREKKVSYTSGTQSK